MKQSGIWLRGFLISLLIVFGGMQAVWAEPYIATDNTSYMKAVQGSTTEKPVIHQRNFQRLLIPSQINGKMEIKQYKLPENTEWVGVAGSNVYLYSDTRVIKKYDPATGKVQDIIKSTDSIAQPYSDGKYIYYVKGIQLMALDSNTGKSTAVLTVPGLKGYSTAWTAKKRALIYNISVVDGYFYYVLSKDEAVGPDSPTKLYRIPLKGPIVAEALLQFDDENYNRAPGMGYLIKNNMLVMANQTRMIDLKTKKLVPIQNPCLDTYIAGNRVYQKLPDETYKEMNITSSGGFIEDQVYKSRIYIPNAFGDYTVATDPDMDITRFINEKTKERKYLGTIVLEKFGYYELSMVGDGAAYAPISNPQKRVAFEKALKVVRELIKPDMDAFEKELVLYDWVVDNVRFDYDTFNGTKDTGESYYWAGMFNNGMAVSAGYASGFNLLLNLADIESEYVTGAGADGGASSWNVVKLNGKWYQADTAMGALAGAEKSGMGSYRYFNFLSAWNGEKHNLPGIWHNRCVNMEDNYFYKKSVRVNSMEALKQVLSDKRDASAVYVIFEGFRPDAGQISSREITDLLPGYRVSNYSETLYLGEYTDIYRFVIEKI